MFRNDAYGGCGSTPYFEIRLLDVNIRQKSSQLVQIDGKKFEKKYPPSAKHIRLLDLERADSTTAH
uniref:Uncharacterized protein n=1 Tax=Romanomermis culicivorax TaxID=13658 RepID=A0A915JJ66_ROMCU